MWRILTIIAGTVLLAVSVVLGFLNKTKIAEEVTLRDQTRSELKEQQKRLEADKKLLTQAEKDREEALAVTKTLTAELSDLKGKTDAAKTELASLQTQLAENKEKIDKLSKDQEGAPDLDAIAGKIADLKKEQAKFAQDVADKEAQLAATESRVGVVQARIKTAEGREEDIRKRISPSELRTSIASVQQALGFVILNAGGNQSVVLGSNLAVMRGNTKIGELVVSSVEKSKSSADIVPGSLAAGQMLMPGDSVVAIRPAPTAAPKAAVAPKAAAPAAQEKEEAKSDDIFSDNAAAPAEETPAADAPAAGEEPKADDTTPAEGGSSL